MKKNLHIIVITFWKVLTCTKNTYPIKHFRQALLPNLRLAVLFLKINKFFASKEPLNVKTSHHLSQLKSSSILKITVCHHTHLSTNKCFTHTNLLIFDGPESPEKKPGCITERVDSHNTQVRFRCIFNSETARDSSAGQLKRRDG